jgi:hypothetical protein
MPALTRIGRCPSLYPAKMRKAAARRYRTTALIRIGVDQKVVLIPSEKMRPRL